MDNKSLSHTRWKCQYHIVFILKYRKKYCMAELGQIREKYSIFDVNIKNVEIIAEAVCVDHVHLRVVNPPQIIISNFMKGT